MKKVVTIGGGTGRFALLSGIKKYPVDISAIVTMSDDGGSTGRLRDEFGVLPPGDVRQCLVALSTNRKIMRALFSHRFENGGMQGHNFGNIFISTLEMITGSMDKALDVTSEILNIKGRVIPVTLDKVRLVTELGNGEVIEGEDELDVSRILSEKNVKTMYLKPKAHLNPKALAAIKQADMVVVGPGDVYTSLIPNFLVDGMAKAFRASKAKKVLVVNLMNKRGQVDGFKPADYVRSIEEYLGTKGIFDVVVFNTKKPAGALLKKYAEDGEPVPVDTSGLEGKYTLIGADVVASGVVKPTKGDALQRALIRHDSDKLAKVLMKLIGVTK